MLNILRRMICWKLASYFTKGIFDVRSLTPARVAACLRNLLGTETLSPADKIGDWYPKEWDITTRKSNTLSFVTNGLTKRNHMIHIVIAGSEWGSLIVPKW